VFNNVAVEFIIDILESIFVKSQEIYVSGLMLFYEVVFSTLSLYQLVWS